MSVAERAPATHQNIAPPSIDTGNSAVCFQSAGQVVTVLSKLDRHFHDNTDLAYFTKHAVAEYAAKRETQIVTVVVTKDSASITEDDATKHLHIQGQDYIVTIGDLRDGRTQMEHINRIIERLKYLQAVMVMLSTTDMLGTSQAVGKQMGGLNAKVKQVQKLGMKLEQFTKIVAQTQKEGKPIPAEVLKPVVAQLNRLNTSANPPEIRKIVQTMLTQVKELRQLPVMRQDVGVAQASKTQLHVRTMHNVMAKPEARFKVPLRLVVSKDTPQQPSVPAVVSEPVKQTRHYTVLTPALAEQIQPRTIISANVGRAIRPQPIPSQLASDSRFHIVPQQLVKVIETRQINAPVIAQVSERTNITQRTTPRFSVIVNNIKQAPVLTTLAKVSSLISTPTTALRQNDMQISNLAVVPPVVHGSQPITQTASLQPVVAQTVTVQVNSNSVSTNPVAEAQPRQTQEVRHSTETTVIPKHSEPQRSVTSPNTTSYRLQPRQDTPRATETVQMPSIERHARLQQPAKPEGESKRIPKTTTSILQQFKDCGCGHCADKAKALSGTRNSPIASPRTAGFAAQDTNRSKPATNAAAEFRPACEGMCLCADKKQKATATQEIATGEREFGRRTRRASAPQANAA